METVTTNSHQKVALNNNHATITAVKAETIKEIDFKKNTYSLEILVSYTNPPENGKLDINNRSFDILESPQKVLITDLVPDGKPIDIEAGFSGVDNSKKKFANIITAPDTISKKTSEFPLAGIAIYLIIGVYLYFKIESFRSWFTDPDNLKIIVSVSVILVVVAVITIFKKSKDSSLPTKFQSKVLFLIVIPFLFLISLLIYYIDNTYHVAIFRSLFLLVVILLPAILYYLFLSRRKASLLQAFYTDLSRLGLLGYAFDPNDNQGNMEVNRRIRVMSYIQKFEIMYGNISPDLAKEIIDSSCPDNQNAEVPKFHKYLAEQSFSAVFTMEMNLPVIIATVLIAIGWMMLLPPWETLSSSNVDSVYIFSKVFHPTKVSVLFAFLGAYFFSIQMLLRRYFRKDLRSNAYLSVVLRIILAIIGTWAITQAYSIYDSDWNNTQEIGTPVINDPDGNNISFEDSSSVITENIQNSNEKMPVEPIAFYVIAFVIGAFPPIAWQMVLAIFSRITAAKFFLPSLKTGMPIRDLEGLTIWHEAKLEEEDVENIQNMATVDIVDLLLNTRFPSNRVIDWIDQAILYNQLGVRSEKNGNDQNENNLSRELLRKYGIRTASGLIEVFKNSKAKNCNKFDLFQSKLNKEDLSQIACIADTLKNNPNLRLIINWKSIKYHPIDDQ